MASEWVASDFFNNALHNRLIDRNVRFEAPDETGFLQRKFRQIKDGFQGLFAPEPHPAPASKPKRSPTLEAKPAEPAVEPDPLHERIDQIMEESRREQLPENGAADGTGAESNP